MKKTQLKRVVLRSTEGFLSTVSDLVLFQIFLIGSSVGKGNTSRDIYRMFNESSAALDEINYHTFREAFYRLKRKGLLETVKEEVYFKPQLTKQGLKKLRELIPTYNKKRPWDKRIYLITYDVAEERRFDRDMLRKTLKIIGCAYLQNSVWLTPYNPRGVLESFVEEHDLHGSIIVSDTGTDGAVGEQSLKELIRKVYYLDDLNERYKNFLREFSKTKKKVSVDAVAGCYLSILKDDPQLPFELLPANWLGDEANELSEGFVLNH